MYSKEQIKQFVYNAIVMVTGITDMDFDECLVSKGFRILPASFLYIFDILEKDTGVDVYEVFRNYTYDAMTINNLSNILYNLQK